MVNNSGIHPKGWRILVKPLELESKTESGIILATASQKEREDMANTTGEVIEIGDGCWSDIETPWCAVGDRVVFAKYSGLLYEGKDGFKYRVINEDNVVAVLDADVKLVDPHLKRGLYE